MIVNHTESLLCWIFKQLTFIVTEEIWLQVTYVSFSKTGEGKEQHGITNAQTFYLLSVIRLTSYKK